MGRKKKLKGSNVKACRFCGKPTSLQVKAVHVDVSGKDHSSMVPAHKRCTRPEVAGKKALWSHI